MVEKKKIPKKLTKGRASSAEVSTTNGSGTTIMMATLAEESKVVNILLYFTGYIGGERVNLLVDIDALYCFALSKVVQEL